MSALKNPRREKFVQCLISGLTQRKAYYQAFPSSNKWKVETVDNKAYALFKNEEVFKRYEELQEKSAKKAVLTRQRKKEILKNIAEDEDVSPSDRIKAIDTDNKMDGEYVNKIAVTGTLEAKQDKMDELIEQLKGSD